MRRKTLILTIASLATSLPTLAFAQGGRATVTRPGWLGIRCEVTVDSREGKRTVTVGVGEVIGNSPAERSGLRPGDRIVRIDGKEIPSENCNVIGRGLEAGDTVRLRIQDHEHGQARDLVIIAGPIPDSMMPMVRSFGRGVEIRTFPNDSTRRVAYTFRNGTFNIDTVFNDSAFFFRRLPGFPRDFPMWVDSLPGGFRMKLLPFDTDLPLDAEFPFDKLESMGMRSVAGAEFTELVPGLTDLVGTDQGLLVTRVAPGTPADRAGLQPGDVVTRVGGRAVHAVGDVRAAVARTGDQPIKVEIIRKGRAATLELVARPTIRR